MHITKYQQPVAHVLALQQHVLVALLSVEHILLNYIYYEYKVDYTLHFVRVDSG